MTSYSNAGGPADAFNRGQWRGCGTRRWKPLEIAAVVMAFWVYWPLGLALIGLKIAQRRGYSIDEAVASVRGMFGVGGAPGAARSPWRPFGTTGNAAFDDWRAAEMAKLDEERRKLDAAQREFAEHLDNLRRARDKDEFDGFMRSRDANRPTAGN